MQEESKIPQEENVSVDCAIKIETILQQLIVRAKETGQEFDSDESAHQWAERKLEQMIEKKRIRHGNTIVCIICNNGTCNSTTGPLIKQSGSYIHKNCIHHD
jgi:hypothetical protein